MKKVLICMYRKNLADYLPLCPDPEVSVCLAFDEDTSLEEYIERIQSLMCKEANMILTDEDGGVPFLASLIASANTDTVIITETDAISSKRIIDAFLNGDDETKLKELVASSRWFKAIKA